MALAATFAAQGMRPASFLPAIKCSSCEEEIEIAAMGDHICSKGPPSPRSQPASLTNAFTIRQMNAHGHMPHAPSPLQQQQQQNKPVSLPKTRVRAPTVTSHHLPAPKAIRPPPPRINPEAANMPFLAPRPPRSDSPLSPALSVRSGSSQGSRPPPPLRSMTSPMPRVFDPRPPSPEMSGNLDCAFPPFMPAGGGGGSRPGTSSGRKMSGTSERGGSRGREGQDGGKGGSHREPSRPGVGSPRGDGGDITTSQGSTWKNGPFDPNRRPSDQAGIAQSSDRRRPSMSSVKLGRALPTSLQCLVTGEQLDRKKRLTWFIISTRGSLSLISCAVAICLYKASVHSAVLTASCCFGAPRGGTGLCIPDPAAATTDRPTDRARPEGLNSEPFSREISPRGSTVCASGRISSLAAANQESGRVDMPILDEGTMDGQGM
ncbi:hypothetical protein LTR02_014540 [Friedmanniomyces endolithicus]|nr:hypothetical protein LTR02_014540 [Friedmanniomyces endolithicus]